MIADAQAASGKRGFSIKITLIDAAAASLWQRKKYATPARGLLLRSLPTWPLNAPSALLNSKAALDSVTPSTASWMSVAAEIYTTRGIFRMPIKSCGKRNVYPHTP